MPVSATEQFPVRYNDEDYDLAKFLRKHPGGTNYLNGFKHANITSKMEETQHSQAAHYLLREYMKGGRDEAKTEKQADLEHLVDWNKGLLWQVVNLGENYVEWMKSPVDRKARVFDSPLLEVFTITPWYMVPLYWVPIILYFSYNGIQTYSNGGPEYYHIPYISAYLALGVFIWTLVEYTLHRFVFHRLPSGKNKIATFAHFILHGFHHKLPFDDGRLVFPPIAATIIAAFLYSIERLIAPAHLLSLLFAGELAGYVVYDMIHFYLHFGSPEDDTHLYRMKRYHNKHHFTHSDTGFGISLTFWDKVFDTTIKLNKLKMSIKW